MTEEYVKNLESKIYELEQRLQNVSEFWNYMQFLLNNSSDILLVLESSSLEIIKCNDVATNVLGYSFDELKNEGVMSLLKPEERKLLKMVIDQANCETEVVCPIEVHLVQSKGTFVFVEIIVKLVKDLRTGISYIIFTAKILKRFKQRLELFEGIINSFPIMLWYKDTSDRIYKVNNAAANFEQTQPSELVGKTSFDLYPREYAQRIFDEDREIINTGNSKLGLIEEHITAGQKQLRWIHACKAPLVNNEGQITGVITFANDITEQRNAQEALRQSEERFRRITHTVTDYIFTVWVENNRAVKTIHGPACISVTGYTSEEFEVDEHLWFNMVLPEDRDIVLENSRNILEGKDTKPFVHRIRKKDNSIRWVTNTPVLHFDDRGQLSFYDGLVRDITEVKRKEQEIIERQARLSSIFKVAPIGIGIIEDTVLTTINHYICDMLGYKEDELINQSAMCLFPSYEEFEHVFREQSWIISNNNTLSIETLWRKKNGDLIDILYNATPIIASDLNQGIMFTAQDITKRKKDDEMIRRSELELRKQNEKIRDINSQLIAAKNKAEESDKLKSAFLANMSHEIRTPMNAILGFTEFLRDPNIDREEFDEFLDIINTSGEQLLRIINDIIDISKIEAGQEKIHESAVNVDNVLWEIQGLFKANAIKAGIEILLFDQNTPREDLMLLTDFTKFKQIITNLVGNAMKFTKVGSVTFGYEIKNDFVEFKIVDTGIGIAPENQKAIFERFRQAENSLTKTVGGTGLGLSISSALVHLLGGKIWVESEINKGSTFYFTLPLKHAPLQKTTESNTTDITFDWHNLKVLVAEDDDINYYYLQKALESTKIKLLRAKNGQMCVDMFKENPALKMILMDIKMPEMDGYQATKIIKEINPNVVIIAQTAFALANEREKALNSGFNDYITKPIDKEKLLVMMEKHLR